MSSLRVTIEVDASPEEVWKAIADFGGIDRWNPGVPVSQLTSVHSEGVGATRHCDLTLSGASIEERVTEWEPGSHYKVEIYRTKRVPFVRNLEAEVGVEPSGDGSIAYFAPSYETTAGPIGRLMDRLVLRRQYEKGGRAFVAGLKYFVETGNDVEKGSPLAYADAAVTRAPQGAQSSI